MCGIEMSLMSIYLSVVDVIDIYIPQRVRDRVVVDVIGDVIDIYIPQCVRD